MVKHAYEPMEAAPKSDVIVAVAGGVETAAYWEGPPLDCWCYWDEDDGGETMTPIRSPLSGWRRLF